jgi:hypothetical protein
MEGGKGERGGGRRRREGWREERERGVVGREKRWRKYGWRGRGVSGRRGYMVDNARGDE